MSIKLERLESALIGFLTCPNAATLATMRETRRQESTLIGSHEYYVARYIDMLLSRQTDADLPTFPAANPCDSELPSLLRVQGY